MVVIRTAIRNGNSLQITLPVYWIEMHSIAKGEKLNIYVNTEGDLVVKPPVDSMGIDDEN